MRLADPTATGSPGAIGDLEVLADLYFQTDSYEPALETLEALLANLKPYEARLHELRGFRGAQISAANLRALLAGSDLATGKLKVKVQDAYSMRSTPQVIGALRDQMAHARVQVEIELNGVADNPIFLTGEDRVLTGANFQGTPVCLPLDTVGKWLVMTRAAVFPMTIWSGTIGALLAAETARVTGLVTVDYIAVVLAIVGLVLAHAANNLINDYFDMTGGVDTEGYVRALYAPHPVLSGWVTKSTLRNAIIGLTLIDGLIMLLLAYWHGPLVIAFAAYGAVRLTEKLRRRHER